MSERTVYDFDWDPTKAILNVRKHGISFEQAASVFLDSLALTVYDHASSQFEERWFTLGVDRRNKLLAVAHTYELGPSRTRIRIISAREATSRERRAYENEPQ